MSRYRIPDPEECEKWLEKNHYWVFRDWEDEASEYMELPDFLVRNHYAILEEWEQYEKTHRRGHDMGGAERQKGALT